MTAQNRCNYNSEYKNNRLLSVVLLWLTLFLLVSTAYAQQISTEDQTERFKVQVNITGLDKNLSRQVRNYLDIEKRSTLPGFNVQRLQQLHRRSESAIKQAMQAYGYYHAQVQGTLIQNAERYWLASYHINPGPRVKIADVDIQLSGKDAKNAAIIDIVRQFSIHKGDFLDHQQYETEKNRLLQAIGELGYADARLVKKQLLVDPKRNTAWITLHLELGQKYYFGSIRFHQSILNQKFMHSFAGDLQPGIPLTQEKLLNLQQRLVKSGYFALVDIKPEFSETKKQRVPVDVTLTPAKRHKLSFGLGYDTELELNTSFRWQNRLLNSYGHYSDVLLKLSSKKSSLRGTWWIPVGEPGTDKLGITSKFETEDTDDTSRDTFDLEAAWLFKWRGWDSRLYTEYKFEHFESGSEPQKTTRLLSLGGRMEGSFIEERKYPRKGWSAYADLRGAPNLVWSDTRYLRLHLKSRYLLPVKDKGRLILRGEVGLANVDDFELYPNSLRFFAGGDQSVRGYDWKSLGPKDKSGQVVGGRNVVSGAIEYNYQVHKEWLVAVFLDAGNAYNSQLDKLYYGAGFGARWFSPVGMIKTDLGWPVNQDDKKTKLDSMVFYLGFEVNL